MLKLYDATTARNSFLKRQGLEDTPLTPAVQASINRLFGEPLTPAQVVERILKMCASAATRPCANGPTRLDGQAPAAFRVAQDQLDAALDGLDPPLVSALQLAAERVRRFHQAQPVTSWMTQAMGGTLGQFVRPIRRVGIYVPAGSAPLPSSVLMSAIPAQVAGVPEIVLVAPPQRGSGQVAPVILAAAALLGIEEVYAMGGAQAIAALAYGTAVDPARGQDLWPGQPVRHPGQTPGLRRWWASTAWPGRPKPW